MANNCLQTKLKSVVENDNLLKLNEFRFGVKSAITGNGCRVSCVNSGNTLKILTPEVTFGDGTTEKPDFTEYTNFKVTGACELSFINKHNISEITGGPFIVNVDDLAYSTFLTVFGIIRGKVTGHLSSLSNKASLNQFVVYYGESSITGNLNELPSSAPLVGIRVDGAKQIAGDISVLGRYTTLTEFTCENNTSIEGSIESMLEGMWANNRRSGNLSITLAGSYVTWNGSTNGNPFVATFSASNIVVKINNNTVGTYDGSTWTYNS